MSAREWAKYYGEHGWVSVPVARHEKKPIPNEWQTRTLEGAAATFDRDFPEGVDRNVGVLLGAPSGGLTDVDHDCDETVMLTGRFLPVTRTFGRKGRPRSHHLFTSADAKPATFKDPTDGKMLVEIRSTGQQTVFPASMHPSGEWIAFDDVNTPVASIEPDDLVKRVGRLAAAALLARHWPASGRHEAQLALAGALLKDGWEDEDAEHFLCAVCSAMGDEDAVKRDTTIRTTRARIDAGEDVTGWGTLARIIDRRVVACVQLWLGAQCSYPLTDAGNAERLATLYGGRIRYVVEWDKWIFWDGSRWVLDGGDLAVVSFAKEAARSLKRSDDPGIRKFALASESRGKIEAAVSLARSERSIQIRHDELDADERILNAPDGIVDLRTGALRPHDPNALCTKITGTCFEPDAKAPRWERFLLEIMNGDSEMVTFLRRAVGYSATGSTREHKLFFLIGSGRNGKGVFVETVMSALGSYAGPVNPALLLAAEGERHLTEIASLHKMRFAACSEINEGKRWDEAKLKRLTGGDTLVARRMREDEWAFAPTHKPWVAANVAPEVRGSNEAIWSRILRIPFPVSFTGREDRTLVDDLKRELPGVLAWIVRGAVEWQAQGLGVPASVRRETDKYREQQDLVGQFVREAGLTGEYPRSVARASYEAWCRTTGSHVLANRQFTEALRQRGVEEVPSRRWASGRGVEAGWYFPGALRLVDAAE